MELLKFISQDGSHFFGTCLILIILFKGTAEVIKAFRPKKVRKIISDNLDFEESRRKYKKEQSKTMD